MKDNANTQETYHIPKIQVTYSIQIGPYDLRLNKDEAIELYHALKKELGIADTYYPPMQPYIPKDDEWRKHPSTPAPWTWPTDPTCPSYPQIWCQQPTSTCNT